MQHAYLTGQTLTGQEAACINSALDQLRSLAKSWETRADSPRISSSEASALKWVVQQIDKALHPEDYDYDYEQEHHGDF